MLTGSTERPGNINLQNDFISDIDNVFFAENHDTNRINDFYPEFKLQTNAQCIDDP